MNITMLWLAAKARRKGAELAVSSHRSQAFSMAHAFLPKSERQCITDMHIQSKSKLHPDI
jgi:hypothetical protein